MYRRIPTRSFAALTAMLLAAAALTPFVVPTDVMMPGTQPGEAPNLGTVSNCDNCHGGYDRAVEPAFNWRGSMMAHAARDPMFWAAVALTEQTFPGGGDLCIRCHSPRGWLEGRSTPTDGSGLSSADVNGTECAVCHKFVNPDDSEHVGVQNPPFVANDGGNPVEAYRGSGMYVLWSGRERLGPYTDPDARHGSLPSLFHRSSDFCGTCHDVSNPITGDVAHNNGAMRPLPPGTFHGDLGGPVTAKAAFNNPPYSYGVVERTYSEHVASRWPTTPINASTYAALPRDLQAGAIRKAYDDAMATGNGGRYADGTTRFFTCQSCHMPPVTGPGCDKNGAPIRRDLPLHDLTGGNYWAPQAIRWLDARNRLSIGGGLDDEQRQAMVAGEQRARGNLERSAGLALVGNTLRVTNLTGHKLISGFHEGRRMWLRVRWYDAQQQVVRDDGAYGPLQVVLDGQPTAVDTILDLDAPYLHIYQAKPGMSQEWATELRAAGLPATTPLEFDRVTEQVALTLGQLAGRPPGTEEVTFRFALNNVILEDTRIPPFGMSYDEAAKRNALPVPDDQFGDPDPGGFYDHWNDVRLEPPPGAVRADIELMYQPTSWEYVQFLYLANDGSVANLASTGRDLLDAWRNTGMAMPHTMNSTVWCNLVGTEEDLALETEVDDGRDVTRCHKTAQAGDTLRVGFSSPDGTFDGAAGLVVFRFYATGNPPGSFPGFPLLHFDRVDVGLPVPALPPGGFATTIGLPNGVAGATARIQALVISTQARNGLFAATDAHDIEFR